MSRRAITFSLMICHMCIRLYLGGRERRREGEREGRRERRRVREGGMEGEKEEGRENIFYVPHMQQKEMLIFSEKRTIYMRGMLTV